VVGTLRFAHPTVCVVPANAGTHNHRRQLLRKAFASVP